MPRPILLLTCRNPSTDFRRPLATALSALGHPVFSLWLKRRPQLTTIAIGETQNLSWRDTAKFARTLRQHPDLLVLNSTNLAFPSVSIWLRMLTGGQWCFDLHDDLLYATAGWRRLRAQLAQRLLLANADFTVHAAPALQRLFPASHHLGNASDQHPVGQPDPDFTRILILASLDARFDFALLETQAKRHPALNFDIWGHIAKSASDTSAKLSELLAAAPNIHHHGPYDSTSLPTILARYSIAFAPYVTPSRLTDTIDPLRYYHCLNAGLEVITTAIPRAQDLADYLHIIGPGDPIGPIVTALATGTTHRNPGTTAAQFNWTVKARRLLAIAEATR